MTVAGRLCELKRFVFSIFSEEERKENELELKMLCVCVCPAIYATILHQCHENGQ